MLDVICTRKEKIWVFLFFKLYKMVLNIIKSESTCGARELTEDILRDRDTRIEDYQLWNNANKLTEPFNRTLSAIEQREEIYLISHYKN